MIFFTRHLYEGYQPGSTWERRALRLWDRNRKLYQRYFAVISALLPRSAVKLWKLSFHDCKIQKIKETKKQIIFQLDTTHAIGLSPQHTVYLTFVGVKSPIPSSGLVGRWWLYEEIHLSSRAAFSCHVMLDRGEFEIEADEVIVR